MNKHRGANVRFSLTGVVAVFLAAYMLTLIVGSVLLLI